ncbi:MAG TPA: hypothetical protein VFE62_18435 [Gemmataceae bacterium]|nr:hypothetical protein [Gemmataceae bacterium]
MPDKASAAVEGKKCNPQGLLVMLWKTRPAPHFSDNPPTTSWIGVGL